MNMKKYRFRIILTSIVILLPILIGLLCWSRLPDQVATHFNSAGQADGWSSKYYAVFGLPLFLLMIHFVCIFSTLLNPRKQGVSPKMLLLLFWICPAVSWLCATVTYLYALDVTFSGMILIDLFLAVLLIVMGNYLPKCRQNYTVGIKLPWTLHDADNWNRTHRLGGKLYILAGFLFLADIFIGNMWIPLAGVIGASMITIGYSLALYLKKGGNARQE